MVAEELLQACSLHLLFAFSPILIQRGNLGWFKSEPFGLFFGLLAVYLFLSAIKSERKEEASATTVAIDYKYNILKAIIAGLLFGLGNGSWGGTQYFSIPISLFMIALPFVRKRKENTKLQMYVCSLLYNMYPISYCSLPKNRNFICIRFVKYCFTRRTSISCHRKQCKKI